MGVGVAEVRQLRSANKIRTRLRKGLWLSDQAADTVVRGIKLAINPADTLKRIQLARAADLTVESDGIEERRGSIRFAPDQLPGQQDAVAAADAIFRRLKEEGSIEDVRANANKSFLVTLLQQTDSLAHPEIFRFAISRPLLNLAAAYFGEIPVLSEIRLWWSPPNATVTSSQMFHRDGADSRQIKFFFNIWEVTPDSGPFTYIPAAESEDIMRRLGCRDRRATDEEIAALGGLEKTISLVGPAGAGAGVDTSRCLHYGSRGNRTDRLVLMIRYTRARAPRAESPRWVNGIAPFLSDLDPLQRLALNLKS